MQEPSLPLSAAQQWAWLLHLLDPSDPVANRPVALRVSGALDISALQRALDEIAARHEALHTIFPSHGGIPRQKILPPAELPFRLTDLTGLEGTLPQEEAKNIARAECLKPFDLENGPLVRVELLRLAGNEHWLVVPMPHIIFDGWSEKIFLYELQVLYEAFSRGRPSPLVPPEWQYRDYTLWQAEWMKGERFASQLDFWRRKLADPPAVLPLPRESAARVADRTGIICRLDLGQRLTQELKQLARKHRVSLFMVMLAAFQTLLARYTDAEDILVGVPSANRGRRELERLIGSFINIQPFRGDLSGDPPAGQLLERTRQAAFEAFSNPDVPLVKLVETLRIERPADRWPLFQAMFQLRNIPPLPAVENTAVQFEPLDLDLGLIGGLDLSLEAAEHDGRIRCKLIANRNSFSQPFADRMLVHYRRLLEAFTEDPGRRIWALPLLNPEEQRQLLAGWNDTGVKWPDDLSTPQLIARQATVNPHRITVTGADRELTYGELERRANQVAHRLLQLGAGREQLVAVAMRRSPEAVAAIVGVLKAGAAYLPLELSHPLPRIKAILEQARPAAILADPDYALNLEGPETHVIQVDTHWRALDKESSEPPALEPAPDDLAYVIFTSGSTGEPKGVMITHRNLSNFLRWMSQVSGATPGDVFLLNSSLSFDLSVVELFLPLVAGARLAVARPGVETDPAALSDLIRQRRVSTLFIVPSALNLLLEEESFQKCTALRKVFSIGETLPPALAERFHSRLGAELFNLYGPTEATVAATFFACRRGRHETSVPIGRPGANMEIYILDRRLQPVPVGVTGEIFIGGTGVARGYFRRPDLTAERFITNPFNTEAGARLYRTGDLGRRRADGNIEFAGRNDDQVKIRGYRVELGEIEAVLLSHPAVKQAAVKVWEPAAGERALAAYIVPAVPGELNVAELKSFLRARLPHYMTPADWVALEQLPLSANGKVNRRLLPTPRRGEGVTASARRAPLSRVEAELKRIWEGLLGLHDIALNESFFDLGGNSILAVKMVHAFERATGVHLWPGALIEAPSIEQLAQLIEARGIAVRRSCLAPLAPAGSRPPLFLFHANGGEVFFYRDLARHLAGDQPVFGVQCPLTNGWTAAPPALEELAAIYLKEIRNLQPHGPYLLAGFCLGAYLAFECACQLTSDGEKVGLLAAINTDGVWRLTGGLHSNLRFHLHRMRPLTATNIARYVRERFNYRKDRSQDLAASFISRIMHACRLPVPPALVRRHARRLLLEASRRWQPRNYRGELVFFKGADDAGQDPYAFWSRIVDGPVHCIETPGRGSAILQEPAVSVLGAHFRELLIKASGEAKA